MPSIGYNAIPARYQWLLSVPQLPKLVDEALKLYGTHEGVGASNNATILAWAAELGLQHEYTADSIPWCGLFIALCCQRSGRQYVPGPLWALNWKKWGVDGGQPELGDILVFVRPGGGHVGIYIGEDREAYHVLGGNTADSVSIARIAKSRLAGCRAPIYNSKPASVKPYILANGGGLSSNEA